MHRLWQTGTRHTAPSSPAARLITSIVATSVALPAKIEKTDPRAPVVPPQVRYDWTLLAPTPVPPSTKRSCFGTDAIPVTSSKSTGYLPSDSLTLKWTMASWKTTFLYKQDVFHFHVSESESISMCLVAAWSHLVVASPRLRKCFSRVWV